MKDKFNKLFFSRTVWTILLMFVVGGFEAVKPSLSPQVFTSIQGVLSVLAIYFKLNPSQDYE